MVGDVIYFPDPPVYVIGEMVRGMRNSMHKKKIPLKVFNDLSMGWKECQSCIALLRWNLVANATATGIRFPPSLTNRYTSN